jgi:hypothetical protein
LGGREAGKKEGKEGGKKGRKEGEMEGGRKRTGDIVQVVIGLSGKHKVLSLTHGIFNKQK